MYWQQQANYVIDVELDDTNQSIKGKETVTYINNSPDVLTYLWLQLDQNNRSKDSDTPKVTESSIGQGMNLLDLEGILWHSDDTMSRSSPSKMPQESHSTWPSTRP